MAQTSIRNIGNVMKYIFLNDRKWYIGLALSGAVLLLGVYLLQILYVFIYNYHDVGIYIYPFAMLAGIGMAYVINASIFHIMRNRKSRMSFLSLPATCMEKYLAMNLTALISFVVMVMILVLTAIILPSSDRELRMNFGPSWNIVLYCSLLLFVFSVTELINSYKYKWNLIVSAFIAGALVIVIMFSFAAYSSGYTPDKTFNYDDYYSYLRPYFITYSVGLWVLSTVAIVWSYRNFKRSQIINFLNR